MSENLTPFQRDALRIIMERKHKNPITGKEIASAIGLKPRASGKEGADLRSIIAALRVKGYPVCASGNGYWWPEDRKELDAYIASFQGRIDEQQEACDGMKAGRVRVGPGKIDASIEKKVWFHWKGKVYPVPESAVELFVEQHSGATKV